MPTYEYVCEKCKHRFEVLLRTDSQKVVCAKCKGKKVTKQYTVFGLNLGAPQERGMSGPLCTCGQGGCAICSSKV
jgi:putative FmdB family regulatory protein